MDDDSHLSCSVRALAHGDLLAVKALCVQCFPIEYPDEWYEELVAGRLITLAALVPSRDGEEKLIVGVIVAQLRRVGETNPEDRDIVATNGVNGVAPHSAASVVYILSLAVLPRFRRRGIASRLLQQLISDTANREPFPLAVYLHVLSTNEAAIDFYCRHGFRYHSTLLNYYRIDHFFHDGLTYVLYINGGRPPWSLYGCCHMLVALLCYPLRSLLRLRYLFMK